MRVKLYRSNTFLSNSWNWSLFVRALFTATPLIVSWSWFLAYFAEVFFAFDYSMSWGLFTIFATCIVRAVEYLVVLTLTALYMVYDSYLIFIRVVSLAVLFFLLRWGLGGFVTSWCSRRFTIRYVFFVFFIYFVIVHFFIVIIVFAR